MGAQSSKSGRGRHPLLSESEYSYLENIFRTNCEKQEHLIESSLMRLWKGQIADSLLKIFINNFFRTEKTIDFQTFIRPYVSVLYGSVDEKLEFVSAILTDGNKPEIPVSAIEVYVYGIVSSYIHQMSISKNKQFLSWQVEKFVVRDEDVKLFANYLCNDLPNSTVVNVDNFEKWMSSSSRLAVFEKSVYRHLYFEGDSELAKGRDVKFIPQCVMLPRLTSFPSILDISNIMCLNSCVPEELRDQWRLLFSTAVHGESFSKLLEYISNKGSTILIIEDKNGHVFGGFAPTSWSLGPNFIGDDSSFLYTLRPTVNIYYPTNYNNHYQYINIQQQTMPNGLGMGGQFGYFGLWLDAEFGHGHCSETCTTYGNYKMMSGSKQFSINHLEVWGIGAEPKKDEDEGPQRSVLDADLGAQALLEMVGKTYHSDGYRDVEEEEKD